LFQKFAAFFKYMHLNLNILTRMHNGMLESAMKN
jgi:hypothetical protein